MTRICVNYSTVYNDTLVVKRLNTNWCTQIFIALYYNVSQYVQELLTPITYPIESLIYLHSFSSVFWKLWILQIYKNQPL